jgi:hypothetical protein
MHQLFVVERRVHVRPQITAVAARADMGVRSTVEHLRSARASWVLHTTVGAVCDRGFCV